MFSFKQRLMVAIVLTGSAQGQPMFLSPSPIAAAPAAGTGNAPITFTFSDQGGWQNLSVVNILINGALDGRHACYLAYSVGDSVLYLVNDPGDALLPAISLNGGDTTSNGQCAVTAAGSSARGTGNVLTLTLNLSFTATFAGNQLIYLAAGEKSSGSNSGWQPLGTRTVPGPTPSGPVVNGVIPPHSIGLHQNYTFTFTDPNGWLGLNVVSVLINNGLDAAHACYLAAVPTIQNGGIMILIDDPGNRGGPYFSMELPGRDTIANSQCSINGSGTSLTQAGNTLTLTVDLTFKPSFSRNQVIYAAAHVQDQNLDSGWQPIGTIEVRDADMPAVATSSPFELNSGSGSTTIEVTGSNFRAAAICPAVCGFPCPSTSVVEFDLVDLETQFVSANLLRAVVPASLLTASRVVPLAVKNPVLVQCQGTQFHRSQPVPFVVR